MSRVETNPVKRLGRLLIVGWLLCCSAGCEDPVVDLGSNVAGLDSDTQIPGDSEDEADTESEQFGFDDEAPGDSDTDETGNSEDSAA